MYETLIRKNWSWSCTTQERGVPRLVINYKPLNTILKWIRYSISNKKDLLDRINFALVFSKYNLK